MRGKGGLGSFAPLLDGAGQLAARTLSRGLGLDLSASVPADAVGVRA